jgi:hypothetical protein
MAARIVEYDFGTKGATKRKMEEMKTMVPDKFRKMMTRYWTRVYENVITYMYDEGIYDTGALSASVRIEMSKTIAPGFGFNYEVVRTDGDASAYIVAGGGGVINPRHKKEVDYAQAVHDGHFVTGKQRRAFIKTNKLRRGMEMPKIKTVDLGTGTGWVPGRPFLDEGINRTEGYLDELLKDYMNDKESVWMADQPISTPYSVPIVIKQSKYG